MKRNDFKKVVKAFSFWKIDKRSSDYMLPNGERLSDYLQELISDLLERNKIAFCKNGNIGDVVDDKIFVPFGTDEDMIKEEQEQRIHHFIYEMICR